MNKLALKWRISRKHLLEIAISNLEVEQIEPEQQPKQERNEVVRARENEA